MGISLLYIKAGCLWLSSMSCSPKPDLTFIISVNTKIGKLFDINKWLIDILLMNSIFIIEVHFPHRWELVDQLPKRNVKVKMSSTFTYVLKRENSTNLSLTWGNFLMPYIFYKAGWGLPSARVTSPEPDSISHWQYSTVVSVYDTKIRNIFETPK